MANADRIIDLLHEAKVRPAGAERERFLAEACGDDAALKEQIRSLLEADADEGDSDFLRVTAMVRPTNFPAEKPGDRIGRYKLLEQIGEGGCGAVYIAEQEEPVRRRVALKVIKLGMDTKQVMARFDAERQALAMMDHSNIAKVLDAGATDKGRPYFVMELVRGIKITDYCQQNDVPPRERLDLFIQVCRAIQHAHQKGIIHRDIKPSNILVASNDGVPVPKVIDFGIAKATQGRLTDQTVYTAFEQFIGTPAYMSPEQAQLSMQDVDTRTDIYSLGVLLYELLTGTTPFDAKELLSKGLDEMRRTIREVEPVKPSTRLTQAFGSTHVSPLKSHKARDEKVRADSRRLRQEVRGDLDWIVMKCLEKERGRRYETANGLAADIQRHLNCEVVLARPPSRLYEFQKTVRRHKFGFAAAGAVAAALVIGLGLSTWLFVQERETRKRAERAEREEAGQRRLAEAARTSELRMRKEAEEQALTARRKAYASDMNLLQKALADDDLGRAQILLDQQRPRNGELDLRGWEWRYFWQFCRSDAAFTLCQRSNGVSSVSFSSQGDLLAVGARDGEVTVWELPGRQIVFQRPGCSGELGRLVFAPEGDLLAYYDGSNPQKAIVLWNGHQRTEVRRLSVNRPARDLAFTRDGRLFSAEVGRSNNITAWDVSRGAALFHLDVGLQTHSSGKVFTIVDDGSRAAYALDNPAFCVRLEDLRTRTELSMKVTDEFTTALAFGHDAQILATGSGYSDGAIKLWDAQFQSLGSLEGHRSWVSSLKTLPDGVTLASASADHTIRLWNLKTRQAIRTLRGPNDELWSMDVSPDGRWLASGCRDGSVSLFDLSSATNRPPPCRAFQLASWADWHYSPDGLWIAALRRDGHLLLGQATTPGRIETELGTHINAFAFAPDSRRLAASDRSGHLVLWAIPGQRVITNFIAAPADPIGFTGDGKLLLTYSPTLCAEWDTATWQEIRRFKFQPGATDAIMCPEAGLIASLTASANPLSSSCEILTLQTPENRRHFTVEGGLSSWSFSPDGKVLALASEKGTLELWDTGTATRTALLRGVLLGYHSVAFSPDGERLVAGSDGQEAIKVWDTHSLQELATLRGQGSMFRQADFNRDTIGAQNLKGVMHFWSAPSWSEILDAERVLQTGPPR